MYSVQDDPCGPGFPIRTSSDQRLLPPSRSFSQGATSFIASRCQGIHQMPFNACSKFRHAQVIRPSCSGTTPFASLEGSNQTVPSSSAKQMCETASHNQIRYADNAAIPRAKGRCVSASRSKRIHDDKEQPGGLPSGISYPRADIRSGGGPGSGVHQISVVELTGFEPVTSCLQSRRSPS